MQSPQGSVVALSSAAATILSVGMLFLGYWGIMDPPPWTWSDIVVIVFAAVGFVSLGMVPLIATAPVEEDRLAKVAPARQAFAVGVLAMASAVVVAVCTNDVPRPPVAPAIPAAAKSR